MAVSKVIYGGATVMDITDTTATASSVLSGYKAYGADGAAFSGALAVSGLHMGASAPLAPAEGDLWLKTGTSTPTPTLSVSVSGYGTYSGSTSNMIDGSTSTYWWSNGAQTAGGYVLITLSEPVTLDSCTVYSDSSSDCPGTNTQLRVSSDGSTWTTVGTCTSSMTDTFSGINQTAVKYVQLYTASSKTSWLKINEITLGYAATTTVAGLYKRTGTSWQSVTSADALTGLYQAAGN